MSAPILRDPQLGLFEAAPTDTNVVWLETFLRQHKRWIKAADILKWFNRADDDSQKRLLRELAAASEWILSGQRGYIHIEHATPDEIHHCCAWLESQAKKMGERAGRLRANAHKLFG